MKRWFLVLAALSLAAGASADPRFFVPAFLRAGAVNEIYVWDEAPVGPFSVEVRRPDGSAVTQARGFSVDRPLSVLGAGNRPLKWSAALVAPDAQASPGPVVVRLVDSRGNLWAERASEIQPRSFPAEDIVLDQTMTELRSKPNKRRDKEAAEIWKIYQTFHDRFPWAGGRFRLPLEGEAPTSAHFGDRRNYRYSDQTTSQDYHRGTDFAVPVGTPVAAAAAGTVALAADRLLTGLTVVVEHAPGVYSVSFHLSQIVVQKGQRVSAGERLGLSGATGLVTGPHLHWEVRVGGVPVDPLDLVIDGLLDTPTVSTVISSVERAIH